MVNFIRWMHDAKKMIPTKQSSLEEYIPEDEEDEI